MTEIYRLRLSRGHGTGSSHSPDWRLYEDRERFLSDLTEAMIEATGRTLPHRPQYGRDAAEIHERNRKAWLACSAWVRHIFKRDPGGHGIQQVIGAEVLVDGEWVDLCPELLPPRVDFGTPW